MGNAAPGHDRPPPRGAAGPGHPFGAARSARRSRPPGGTVGHAPGRGSAMSLRGSRRRGLASITGPVLRPADAGYAAEIAAVNTAVPRRPGSVVGAQSEDDVITAVAGAGADGLPVAVKGAGHGAAVD